MQCPNCGKDNDHVIDSRVARNGAAIRRRRICNDCGCRYTTYEEINRDELVVVKRDGRRQPFLRQKLEDGLHAACRKRALSPETISGIVDRVMAAIPGDEVSTEKLGELVMRELRSIDVVAYVRFASVYRGFQNVNEFISLISELEK